MAERLKDVEAQRDALHNALRNLLERQEYQDRESAKRIQALEGERDRLLSSSPKTSSYERDVAKLRDEINVLRRRAEDAIEQKWQVEKGLAGLRMDLDRAEAEIASLRSLLAEKDILIPATLPRGSPRSERALEPVSSATLETAYRDLQSAYADALERAKTMEGKQGSGEKTELMLQRLRQSLDMALSERDMARAEVEAQNSQISSLEASEQAHIAAEGELADQLDESVRRVEELAGQGRTQLGSNAALRTRLVETVSRGEANQRASIERISDMQSRLRCLEASLLAAQSVAEERVAKHEEEVATLKDAHATQLQRLNSSGAALGQRGGPAGGARSPGLLHSPRLPVRPSSASSANGGGMFKPPRSPMLGTRLSVSSRPGTGRSNTTSADGNLRGSNADSMAEQVDSLRRRVAELEGALAAADSEMQEVVGRMNTAQIEVLELQEEREEAVRQTRRLQRQLDDERLTSFKGRFRTLTTEVMSAKAQ